MLVAAAIVAAVAILNADRGVPLAALIVIVLMVVFTFITERTRYGRHIFAVGGNEEAARRAGIRVNRIKISVFALASTLAAAGGILAASRLLSVNQQSGSGDVLLLAIAGPVIAGTSLFGGRGFIWSALLGAIVIGSISNGMDLLALDSDIKFMITGAVLLAAVTIDAVTRLRREHRARAPARGRAPGALIGFGLAGSVFHAPLIAATPGIAAGDDRHRESRAGRKLAASSIPDARSRRGGARSGSAPASTTSSSSRPRTTRTPRSRGRAIELGSPWSSTSRWRRPRAARELVERAERRGSR